MRTLTSPERMIPAYGAVTIDGTRIVAVHVVHGISGASTLTITARGGVAAFMTATDCPVQQLSEDETYEVSTPVDVAPLLLESLELTLRAWVAEGRAVRLDWERRESALRGDHSADYLRIWPTDVGAAPMVFRRPAAIAPPFVSRGTLELV